MNQVMTKPEQTPQINQDYKNINRQRNLEQMRENQNLLMGIVGGLIGAVVGAVIWGGITYFSGWQIGWMAVGVGFLVGFGMRKLGNGVDPVFGITGAVLSLAGCLAGNLYSACIFISFEYDIPISQVISRLNMEIITSIFKETFSPMDVLFYGLAIYYGYKFSMHVIEKKEQPKVSIG